MKLRISLLSIILLLPTFIFADSIIYTFCFSKQDLNFSSYNGYDVVSIKDGVTNTEVDKPSIPFIIANFLIPPSAEVTEAKVISKKTEVIPGVYNICPVQQPRPISTKEDIPFANPDPSIYNSREQYPGEDIVSFLSGSMSGFRIAGITVNPLKYIPKDKKLILTTEITVSIDYREGVHNIISLSEKQRDAFKDATRLIILNRDDIESFSPPIRTNKEEDVNYVIITSSAYSSNFQQLANWVKLATTWNTEVKTRAWISSNYSGNDIQEKIRNFLKDYFTNYGLIYAILGGDVEIIPERDASTDYYSPYYIASDYYYSDLDGTWDANGNLEYGEISGDNVDGYFDIFVGRLPIDDAGDITAILNKIHPYLGYNVHNTKILLPSVMLFSAYNYHGRVVNNYIGNLFEPWDWTITKLEDANAYQPNTRNYFNQNYMLMHIAAHGDWDGTYSEYGTAVFTNSDIPNLTNSTPTILNSIACYVGDFDGHNNCFAEQLMNKSGAGCVAVAMNSRYGWGTPPDMGPSETMDLWFYNRIKHYKRRLGIIHAATKNYYRNLIWSDGCWHYCGLELNLFADPAMPISGPIRLSLSAQYIGPSKSTQPYVKLHWNWNWGIFDSSAVYQIDVHWKRLWNGQEGTIYAINWTDRSWEHAPVSLEFGQCMEYTIDAYTADYGIKTSSAARACNYNDDIIAKTADKLSTAYNNSKKIVVGSDKKIHISFTSNDTVYYIYSDDGITFSKSFPVGIGKFPGIALDGNEVPHICWTREYDGKGYMINYSKLTGTGWSDPIQLLLEYKKMCTPSSFDIDKAENVAHLTWADFRPYDKWLIYKGNFSLLDTTPQIVPIPYDSAVQMTPESPNYLCDQEKVEGYLLWEKEGEIYAAVEYEDGMILNKTNISSTPNPSIHPNLSIWGDSLYAVWQEDFPWGRKILMSTMSIDYHGSWSQPREITNLPQEAEFPVCFGPIVIASCYIECPKERKYEIYGARTYEFGDIVCSATITSLTSSRYPSIFYTQTFPKQSLWVLWTEDTTKQEKGKIEPVIGYCKVRSINTHPIPIRKANLGGEDDSPYTFQREGFKYFGHLAYQNLDYHSEKLIYQFSGLKPSERYKLKLVFYYEKSVVSKHEKWMFKVKAENQPVGTAIFKLNEKFVFEKWIPFQAYQNGNVNISIEKLKGDYVVCSEIFLYEYQKPSGKGATQLAENGRNFSQRIKFFSPKPNPFNSSIEVGFVIPIKEKVSLKIYDASGRLIKTLVNKTLDTGTYYYNWDGKGEGTERSVSGVYFSVLNVGERRFVRKIINIK